MFELWSALSLSVCVGAILRNREMALTAIALLGNWVVNTAIVQATQDPYNWLCFATVDYATAMIILGFLMGTWPIGVIFLYGIEMLVHAGFALTSGGANERYHYWYALDYLAWAQIAWLGVWASHDGGKIALRRFDPDRRIRSLPALLARMGGVSKSGRVK